MANIKVNIKGLKSVIGKLNKLDNNLNKRIVNGVDLSVTKMQSSAKRDAPSVGDSISRLGGDIESKFNIPSSIEKTIDPVALKGTVEIVGSPELLDMSAFINFGTGGDAKSYLANKSAEWKEMALQFLKDGRGRILGNGFFTDNALKMEDNAVKNIESKIKGIKL